MQLKLHFETSTSGNFDTFKLIAVMGKFSENKQTKNIKKSIFTSFNNFFSVEIIYFTLKQITALALLSGTSQLHLHLKIRANIIPFLGVCPPR